MASFSQHRCIMKHAWKPSWFGKLFTSSKDWEVVHTDEGFWVTSQEHPESSMVSDLSISHGLFWSTLEVADIHASRFTLKGIPNSSARFLTELLRRLSKTHAESFWTHDVCRWMEKVRQLTRHKLSRHGWIGQELQETLTREKPSRFIPVEDRTAFSHLDALFLVPAPLTFTSPLRAESKLPTEALPSSYVPFFERTKEFPPNFDLAQFLSQRSHDELQAIYGWTCPLEELVRQENEYHLRDELVASKDFLDSVEKSPLTEEQRKAVITCDNRMMLVAAAGSGKTSVIVAKAGYVLTKGYFEPSKVLILAFNSDAAEELRERVKVRLSPFIDDVSKVKIKTFHALGLEIIGLATGKKPSVPAWVAEDRKAIDTIIDIIKKLCEVKEHFRSMWNLFRFVLAHDLPAMEKDGDAPDSWDRDKRRAGFSTKKGDVVKSRSEALLANWLYYHGVEYEYEKPYCYDTRDELHSQYHPDFYLPQIDAYLELYAVDAAGDSPFGQSYLDSMKWKSELHQTHGTTLLFVTTHGLRTGEAFAYLTEELPKRGIRFVIQKDESLSQKDLTKDEKIILRTFRTFMTHIKSNRMSIDASRIRVEKEEKDTFKIRHLTFLSMFSDIWKMWDAKLKAENGIDFEDMLNQAADILSAGTWQSPYELVLVDEFQDASQARARLVKELVRAPEHFLFAVGDDWQSINRFAGADISVMQNFEAIFGKGSILKLETTFRCPQSLCDVSSEFVSKNPAQLRKIVRSKAANVEEPVKLLSVRTEEEIASAIAAYLGTIPWKTDKKTTVFVLGRYNFDRQFMPDSPSNPTVELRFVTVHSSKGLEADYIIIPRLTSEKMGFPCGIHDDPVLQLAMPFGDAYEFAEERRLFYVALTRAKKQVCLVTVEHKISPFVTELIMDFGLELQNTDGSTPEKREVCPRCGKGLLVKKKGKYGDFWSCNKFPACRFSRNIGQK